jgi:hypothetical protein
MPCSPGISNRFHSVGWGTHDDKKDGAAPNASAAPGIGSQSLALPILLRRDQKAS